MLSGWEFFKAGRYREAVETFNMADAIMVGEPSEREANLRQRAECKLAILYGAFAGAMHSQATGAMSWLLQRDRVTNELPDPLFLARIKDIREKYDNPATLSTHVRMVETLVAGQQQRTAPMLALRAFALWSDRGNVRSRTDGLHEAKTLANPGVQKPWPELYGAMLRADSSTANESVAASRPTDVRLPWEPAE